MSTHAAAAIRLLMLTGCRRNEILELRWEDVDLDAGELRLPDGKTGPRLVPLSEAAASVLSGLPRVGDSPWVIGGSKPGRHLAQLQPAWERVRKRAGLDDVRIHDLRHSFASRALALGEGLPMIGKLLGHTQVQTTSRYAHLARDSGGSSSPGSANGQGSGIWRSASWCRKERGRTERYTRAIAKRPSRIERRRLARDFSPRCSPTSGSTETNSSR